MPPHQRAERRGAHQAPAHHAEPGGRHVQEHDFHRGALLIVVGRAHRAIEPGREQQHGRRRKPRQHAVDDVQKARRVGEIDDGHRRGLPHSSPKRSAAAAAKGPIMKLPRLSAQRMVKAGPKAPDPLIAASAAATPKINTGTVNGNTNTANNKPPRRSATDSAAPINPMKVSAGVPAASVSISAPIAFNSTLSISPSSGAMMTSGNAVVSQCASALTATESSSGVGAVIKRSSEPSS